MFTTRSICAVRVGALLLRDVELFHALGGRLVAQAHATQELLDPSRAWMDVESLCVAQFAHWAPDRRHKTSDTRMVPPFTRVMCAGDSTVPLPSGASAGALCLQRYKVLALIPPNIPGRRRRTSATQCCMAHRRSVFHWWDMSRNQSLTMGSTWTFVAFCRAAVLPLGSSSTSAAAGVEQAAQASCVSRTSDCPGRHQPGRCKRTPCASSWWWTMCSCRAHCQRCCMLGRLTDFACLSMAARTARTSSSEEGARSIDGRSLADEALHREAVVKTLCWKKQLYQSEKTSV